MVAALGLGKFYGGSLPRPRFYDDVKLNGDRVDPPLPVTDALMAWAEEAHWSMGGACTTRHRLQGRIEGNVNKLRVQRETLFKKSSKQEKSVSSPARTVTGIKRRREVRLVDEEEEEQSGIKIRAATKLGKSSGRDAAKIEVQSDGGGVVHLRKSKRKEEDRIVVKAESNNANEKSAERQRSIAAAAAAIRSSPRLAKTGRSR